MKAVTRASIISTTGRPQPHGRSLHRVDTVTRDAHSTSSDARCEAGVLLKGPEDDPEPLTAAWFRLLVLHLIRVADRHILGVLGEPVSDDNCVVGT